MINSSDYTGKIKELEKENFRLYVDNDRYKATIRVLKSRIDPSQGE